MGTGREARHAGKGGQLVELVIRGLWALLRLEGGYSIEDAGVGWRREDGQRGLVR